MTRGTLEDKSAYQEFTKLIEKFNVIKIDVQSSDFNIIKGMDKYMNDRVVYIDVETSTNGQYHFKDSPIELKMYLENNGFECLSWGINATFVNTRFKHIINEINHYVLDL